MLERLQVEVEVDVPTFRPLPGLLVFPNLPFLGFWIFNAGLVKKAVGTHAHSNSLPP